MNTSKTRKLNLVVTLLAIIYSAALYADSVQRGKFLYREGISVDKATASVAAGIEVEAKIFPCQSCHQSGATGGFEGGVTVPPINWRALTVRLPWKKHTAYDENLIKRAIEEGIDSEGNVLHTLMPRYKLSETDFQNLLNYIKSLDYTSETGVGNDSLRIGVILTENSKFEPVTNLVRKILGAYFRQLNELGGIHGRTVELVYMAPDDLSTEVLCYVAALIPASELDDLEPISKLDIPVLFPISQLEQRLNKVVTFHADLQDQLSSLLTHIQNTSDGSETVSLIIDDDKIGKSLHERLGDHTQQTNRINIIRNNPASLLKEQLSTAGDRVLWFSRQPNFVNLVKDSGRRNTSRTIYTSIDLVGDTLSTLPANLELILSNPRGTPVFDSDEYKTYQNFRHSNFFPDQYTEWQRSAYLAASLLAVTLKQAGRRINRQKLYQTATSIRDFPAGVTPPITTSVSVSKPSQILKFDTDSRSLSSLENWLPGKIQ